MSENYYNLLEVSENASPDEIKKSYRKLSMMYHPDKNKNNPDATAKFQKISEAYETLSDTDKKKEYDLTRNNPFIKMMNGQHMNTGANPIDEIFSNFFGVPFGSMPSFPGNANTHSPNIRIYHNGVPVNAQGFAQGLQKPTPIIKNVVVPIDKILTGTTLPVEVERWIIQNGNKEFEHETVYVQVPKGADEGEIIVLREKGNVINENCKGDIKLFIKIENDTEFRRVGLDLLLEKTITVKEALCGFSFELKYITGKVYTINNFSGNIISHGYRKLIPNMGFSRDQHTGNLVIIFNVKFPDKLSEEVMEQLKMINF
jgi:DnaJ-class molecular chaperone